ncbi:MAG: MMPL family transporter, partial [Luteolibacter sp.]
MILLGLVGFSIAGLTRLRLETNILEVLPRELASVDALKVYQERFDEDHQLILLLEGEEEIFEEDVESFVLHLRERLSDSTVLYRSELEDDPALLAESLAEVWRYAPPEDVERLGSRLLEPEVLKKHLEEVKEGIGSSFDQQKSTFAAYDPLGFLEHRGMTRLMESEFSFQNEEATSQLILITKGNPARDYASDALWLEKVRKAADTWTGLAEFGLSCRLTGGPAFSAEIGAGMEEDMSGTVSITMILVGLLFLLVQRHPGQLAMIGLLLGLVFLVTLGIGGWVFGTLNLVSVGFAAILLGLVVDYAVVICRDAAGAGRSVSELRSEIAPSILWAAFTTAIVFGLLTLSTFT